MPRPTIRLRTLAPDLHRPPPYTMAASEPWAVGDTPDVELHSVTTAMLSADIETLAAFKDTIQPTPVKAVFESVIGILTLVRVKSLVLFPFSRPLIGEANRTRWDMKIRSWNWSESVSEHATC